MQLYVFESYSKTLMINLKIMFNKKSWESSLIISI